LQITGTALTSFSNIGHAVSFTSDATVGWTSTMLRTLSRGPTAQPSSGSLTKLGRERWR